MTNLKRMRLLLGLKQKDLAGMLGIKAPAVTVLERKGCYDTRTAVRYAKAMKCNPIFLLDGLNIVQSEDLTPRAES